MRCNKFIDIISAYVDSEASALEQLALQEHLKSCSYCKAELESQYMLRDMVKEAHGFADVNINITSSVMARISEKKDIRDEMLTLAGAGGAIARTGSSAGWVAMALMFAITMTAVFSAHKMQTQVAVAEENHSSEYASYVYEHLATPELTGLHYSDPQMKQVSFSK